MNLWLVSPDPPHRVGEFGIDFDKKNVHKNFPKSRTKPYILDFENLSKSITRKILVGGIYGWSLLIRLIETVILTPHLPR